MMNNITITTTNQIENASIDKYLGIITTNIVVGTNLFSDFAASFTDFFGGNSGTYQRKLQLIYRDAVNDLSAKALIAGANCILGLHIDFDEISGKNKSMFMVSLIGTAVKINYKQKESTKEYINSVSAEHLQNECLKKQYMKKFKEEFPSGNEWDYILSHEMPELAETLYKVYIKSHKTIENEEQRHAKQHFPTYLSRLDYPKAIAVVYSDIESEFSASHKLISDLKLFNAEAISDLIKKGNIKKAISLLDTTKNIYNKEDLQSMQNLVEIINNFPNLGSIEMVKGGLLSKDTQKYICPNGHKNSLDKEFCTTCGLNIKGLTQIESQTIKNFIERVDVLEDIFKSKE